MAKAMLNGPIPDKYCPLTNAEIIFLFGSPENVDAIPFKPKGGQVFVFRPRSASEKDDWRADGRRWCYGSTKKLPRKGPMYKKSYFYAKGEDGKPLTGFRKDVYFPLENPDNIAVVHFIGNEGLSLPGKHGNSLKQTKLFFRTKPSVLKRIADEVQEHAPHKVYNQMITEQPEQPERQINEATDRPRNVKQLSNMKAVKSAKQRLSRDAIMNLHEMAYEENGYIWHITTYPDLIVICKK